VIALVLLLAAADAGAPRKEGPNDKFLKPDLDVPSWVDRFEKPGREVYDKRNQIMAAASAHLGKGDSVADVGAGTGLFTMLFSEKVGREGMVYAVEIAPKFLDYIGKRARKAGKRNVTPVRGTTTSVELPPESVDLVFLCDTYHHFETPKENLASIKKALRRDGELVVVDFKRVPGKTAAWITEHVRAGQEQVRAEIEAAGFVLVQEIPILNENFMLRFQLRQ
jgi:ubiquinone/menaquinone biosynthesis C-methylase UbiE